MKVAFSFASLNLNYIVQKKKQTNAMYDALKTRGI